MFILTSACVREEVLDDIKEIYFQPQLVIHAAISPGDSIFVNVAQTVPLGDSVEMSKVSNAKVTLIDDQGNTIELPLLKDNYLTTVYGISQLDFPIQADGSYTLAVTHPNLPAIEASCTVPANATPLQEIEYVGISAESNQRRYNVRVSWFDTSQYLHRVYFIDNYQSINSKNGDVLDEGTAYHSHDPFHTIEKIASTFTYYDDFILDGIHYTELDTIDGVIHVGNPIQVIVTHQLTVHLVTPDKHLAKYQESFDFYSQNRDALSADSFIELYRGIIPEYTNIKGGLGVFGAYLRSDPYYLNLNEY